MNVCHHGLSVPGKKTKWKDEGKEGKEAYDGYVPTDHYERQGIYRHSNRFLSIEDSPVERQKGEFSPGDRGCVTGRSRDVSFQEDCELRQRDRFHVSA